jgi:hypothetical protein
LSYHGAPGLDVGNSAGGQNVFFNIGQYSLLSGVFTFVLADLPIGIIIILLHMSYSAAISNLQHYT